MQLIGKNFHKRNRKLSWVNLLTKQNNTVYLITKKKISGREKDLYWRKYFLLMFHLSRHCTSQYRLSYCFLLLQMGMKQQSQSCTYNTGDMLFPLPPLSLHSDINSLLLYPLNFKGFFFFSWENSQGPRQIRLPNTSFQFHVLKHQLSNR